MSTEMILGEEASVEAALCKNCASELHGHCCSHCGQHDRPLDPTVHDLLHEQTHEFLHLDGKIFNSFRLLLFYPGRLSAEFLAGRRTIHIGPVRLYLTASLLFFLLMGYQTEHDRQNRIVHIGGDPSAQTGSGGSAGKANEKKLDAGVATAEGKTQDATAAGNGGEAKGNSGHKQWLEQYLLRKLADPKAFKHELIVNISHGIFFMVPLFALFLWVAYQKRSWRYPAYIYFSLHTHAFVFLLFSFLLLLQYLKMGLIDTLTDVLVFSGPLVYLFFALRCVFGGSMKNTALRVAAVSAVYGVCLLLVLLGTIVLTIVEA